MEQRQQKQQTTKRPYQITGAVLLLFSAYMARESAALKFYTPIGPGPGFFPLLICGLLALFAAGIFYNATFGKPEPLPEDFFASRAGYLRVVAVLAALAGVVVLMQPLGFRLSTLAFLIFLLFALGRQNLLLTLVVALAGSLGVYYAFEQLLKVPLPVGMLGF